jgi:hypothetical protein
MAGVSGGGVIRSGLWIGHRASAFDGRHRGRIYREGDWILYVRWTIFRHRAFALYPSCSCIHLFIPLYINRQASTGVLMCAMSEVDWQYSFPLTRSFSYARHCFQWNYTAITYWPNVTMTFRVQCVFRLLHDLPPRAHFQNISHTKR